MILAEMTWQEVEALDRNTVVIIPTGSTEQHGPFLPLFTDSLIATAVCNAVDSDKVLITPCVWLGASGHHLPFAGTLSASVDGYLETVSQVIESLHCHRFHKFLIINGHGGNNDFNSVALRTLKQKYPNLTLGHSGYYSFAPDVISQTLEGDLKCIQHACEAEVSLMLHLYPEKVRVDKLRDDGLRSSPLTKTLVKSWDEISEEGSFGFATLGTAAKGKVIFGACVEGLTTEIDAIHQGFFYQGIF